MNDFDHDQHAHIHHPLQASAGTWGRVDRSPGDDVSEFARHGDPSLDKPALRLLQSEPVRSEIVWMRPTELVPVVTGRVAGQGIDLEASIARRARTLPTQSVAVTRRAIRDRGVHLPPVTAFGNGRHAHGAVRRSGIGR